MKNTHGLAVARRAKFESDCAEYLKQLFRFVLSLTRNKAEAEEIAQQTILLFLEFMNRRQWAEDVRDVKAYLFTIAKNLCVELWRRPREEGLVDNDDEQTDQVRKILERKAMQENDPTSRLEDAIHYKELFESLPLQVILDGLNDEELELLLAHAVEESTPKEIAKDRQASEETIRYQLTKLYAKIRYRARKCMD